MFYIVSGLYAPNTAPNNRVMGYVRALSQLEINANVVFFMPDRARSKCRETLPHISFHYLWDNGYLDIPRLRLLSLRYYMRHFVRSLVAGDKVFVYGFPDMVTELAKHPHIEVFAERTEHDSVSFVCHAKKVTIPDFHKACRRISGMIVISKGLKDHYIEHGCKPECVHIINMFVDKQRFINLQKYRSEPYIAYCGTASNTKDGVDQLIRAFALTVITHPEYKLFIIGATPSNSQMFDNLELVKQLGIEHKVVFTGIISEREMPQMLMNASILALDRPDNIQAKYGFPSKLGEYLLTGNPVVLTSVGDIPLFLSDGENALLVEPQNPQAFAEKLCWAIEHPDEARVIGTKGKQVAMMFFDSVNETKKLIEIIKPQ